MFLSVAKLVTYEKDNIDLLNYENVQVLLNY